MFFFENTRIILLAEIAGFLRGDPALTDSDIEDHDTDDDTKEHTDGGVGRTEGGCFVIVPVAYCIINTGNDLRNAVGAEESAEGQQGRSVRQSEQSS